MEACPGPSLHSLHLHVNSLRFHLHGERCGGWSSPPLLGTRPINAFGASAAVFCASSPAESSRSIVRVCLGTPSEEPRTRNKEKKEDDYRGAAQIRADQLGRGGHVARASLRRQAALGTPARAGSGAHHQEKQVQTWQERHPAHTGRLTNK